MTEKISVAMAAYQGAEYIKEQLDSILCQLGAEDEIVVSYDKSADHTLEILEAYRNRDARVKIFHNGNPGVTGNFNNAITHCTGDYIYISDQDDKWAENKVEVVQRCFRESGADYVFHNATHTNERLEPIDKPFFELYGIEKSLWKEYTYPRMSGCCMAFRRKMKNILLPIPETGGYDQWLAMMCFIWGKVAFIDDILLYHRLHSDNVTPLQHRPYRVIFASRAKVALCVLLRSLKVLVRGKK